MLHLLLFFKKRSILNLCFEQVFDTIIYFLGTSLITAANFCQNGKLAVVGTYDGRCIFYDTEVGHLFSIFGFCNVCILESMLRRFKVLYICPILQ